MSKLIITHCFPVPYRSFLFDLFQKQCSERDIDFSVFYESRRSKTRMNWRQEHLKLKHRHEFFHPLFHRDPVLYFNPSLIFKIIREKPDIIVVGGLWTSINSILLLMLCREKVVVWDEVNRYDHSSKNPIIVFFKRKLLSRVNNFAYPGVESLRYYEEILGNSIKDKRFFKLPNLVNDEIFSKNRNQNQHSSVRKAIWPARHIGEKGIIEFLTRINPRYLECWTITIYGSGPLEDEIKGLIRDRELSHYIKLVKDISYETFVDEYRNSNAFLLPSKYDSNPLSVIEALHVGLPIFISNRLGNFSEVLIENRNGISFDFDDVGSFEESSKRFFSLSLEELKKMGAVSVELSEENFASSKVVREFLSDII